MNTKTRREARFIFNVAEGSETLDFSVSISDVELSRFGSVGCCISKIKRLIPKSITTTPKLLGQSIHLVLSEDENQKDVFDNVIDQVEAIVGDLNALILNMKANSNSETPVSDALLSIRTGDVETLKAVLKANQKNGLEVNVEIDGEPIFLERLEAADFTPIVESASKKDHVRHLIVGLRRDDENGHVLIVSNEDVRIRLTSKEEWPFSRIEGVLRSPTYFEGTITKAVNGEWQATSDACLHAQQDAFR